MSRFKSLLLSASLLAGLLGFTGAAFAEAPNAATASTAATIPVVICSPKLPIQGSFDLPAIQFPATQDCQLHRATARAAVPPLTG